VPGIAPGADDSLNFQVVSTLLRERAWDTWQAERYQRGEISQRPGYTGNPATQARAGRRVRRAAPGQLAAAGPRRGLTNNGTASGVSRWRAKCLRLGEVNAVDYFAHPAHMIRVTASD
jgi:hypothetical protein